MLIVVRVGTRTMGTIVGTMLIVERVVLASSLRKDSDAANLNINIFQGGVFLYHHNHGFISMGFCDRNHKSPVFLFSFLHTFGYLMHFCPLTMHLATIFSM